MHLKRNLYYARRDHVQWSRVKVVLVQRYQQNSLQGSNWSVKKLKNGRSTIDQGLVRVKNGQIEKPLAPRDFLPEKPPRYKIILIKIIYHH